MILDLLPRDLRESIAGDLAEEYESVRRRRAARSRASGSGGTPCASPRCFDGNASRAGVRCRRLPTKRRAASRSWRDCARISRSACACCAASPASPPSPSWRSRSASARTPASSASSTPWSRRSRPPSRRAFSSAWRRPTRRRATMPRRRSAKVDDPALPAPRRGAFARRSSSPSSRSR